MLTEWAMRERQWGSYPALRRLLEHRPSPDRWQVLSSVQETQSEAVGRLLEVADRFAEAEEEVVAASRMELHDGEGRQRVVSFGELDALDADLALLADQLRSWRDLFHEAALRVERARNRRARSLSPQGSSPSGSAPEPPIGV